MHCPFDLLFVFAHFFPFSPLDALTIAFNLQSAWQILQNKNRKSVSPYSSENLKPTVIAENNTTLYSHFYIVQVTQNSVSLHFAHGTITSYSSKNLQWLLRFCEIFITSYDIFLV